MNLDSLMKKFILARWQYQVSPEEGMSDEEYNRLEAQLRESIPENVYFNRTWSEDPCPTDLLKEVGREDLIRGVTVIHKSESIPSLRSEVEYRRRFAGLNKRTRVSMKIDGWNTQVNYYNGKLVSVNSRGRDTDPIALETVSHIVPDMIPMMGIVKIVGETSIKSNMWQAYKEIRGAKQQRASVITAITNGDHEYLSLLAFNIISEDNNIPEDKYPTLKELGFKTPAFMMVDSFEHLDKAIKLLGKRKNGYEALTDGVVVENESTQLALRIYSWQESSTDSYVMSYQESPTCYGYSPSISIKPTDVDERTISSLAITNFERVQEFGLFPGSPIAFVVRSGADPVFDETRTLVLKEQWDDNLEEYKEMIDRSR